MDIKALADKYEEYIIERRKYYHAHPELPEQEKETRAQIHKDLEALGITDIRDMENCYGLVATIHGAKPGKTIGVRADIDALPIKEDTGCSFASVNEGKMHACGHDTHIAMLLGAAKILNDVKDELCGNVRLLVQPSEELATGAKGLVAEGAVDDVDAVYGAHIMGLMDSGLIDCSVGNRMACCHSFSITVNGVAAHGSAPNLGIDAVTVSCAMINNIQQIVSRQNDPLNPLVITIGTINGGSRFNVIANKVVMEGTVRTFSLGKEVEDAMRKVIEDTAKTFGTTASLEYKYLTPPLINMDPELNALMKDTVVKLYGEEAIGSFPTMMGSEDFPWYAEDGKRPYYFSIIGGREPGSDSTISNHHEKFLPEESALKRGSAVMAQFAFDYLKQNAK